MSDPNFFDQAGNFTQDAAVDTAIDGFVNQEINNFASCIPGGQSVEQMLTTEVDQVINNDVNNELNKGINGMIQDAEGLFERF